MFGIGLLNQKFMVFLHVKFNNKKTDETLTGFIYNTVLSFITIFRIQILNLKLNVFVKNTLPRKNIKIF